MMTDAHAPDGSPVEAFALLPPGPAPDVIHAAIPAASQILDLGCGAGRIAHELIKRGHTVVGVDQSPDMLAYVRDAKTVLADIETLDLQQQFDVVLLGSNLINTPDRSKRAAFIATCARHMKPDGAALIQRLDPELVPDAVDAESTADGVTYSLSNVEHAGTLFIATVGFTIGDRHWSHRFQAEVLDDDALAEVLTAGGLGVEAYLDKQKVWVKAVLS